jgi:hypothetical protein
MDARKGKQCAKARRLSCPVGLQFRGCEPEGQRWAGGGETKARDVAPLAVELVMTCTDWSCTGWRQMENGELGEIK